MKEKNSKLNFGLIMALYLLGIFMGALDTGIVTPARTVIQDSLGVGETTGIWLITIYTLAYASSIPVMGKLADRMGRRTIYLISIILFGGGSLMCGLSHNFDSFGFLLVSRAIQAIGGGGILPVATAEFGTTFPEEKRGMALGMVGGVYGIANIFGASAGSAVMDIFGTDRWEFIFYVNVPIAIFIIIAGIFALPNTKEKSLLPIDGLGIGVLVVMILSLMYGLKSIDFFNFQATITDPGVYRFLIVFVVLLPIFILIERKAKDPVMNLKYFTNFRIVMVLVISIITGIIMMGVVFIPEFCENALKVAEGSGGYFVIILGICAGVGAMSSGKMTDRIGPKIVLSIGLIASIIGSLIIILFASKDPNKINVFASLIFIGLGIGFTMGAPLNYMMLWEVDEKESNSALATLSLVRSIGTVVAPAIMVGFIAHAGAGISDNIMELLPAQINVPELPYAEELMNAMKEQDIEGIPNLADMQTIEIDMDKNASNPDFEIPDSLIKELKDSSVTTITASTKHMAKYFFKEMSPDIQKEINDGIDKGINGINDGITKIDSTIADMSKAESGIQQGIDGMNSAISNQTKEKSKLESNRSEMLKAIDGISAGISQIKATYEAEVSKPEEEQNLQMIAQLQGQLDEMEKKQSEMQTAVSGMEQGIKGLNTAINQVKQKQSTMKNEKNEMEKALTEMKSGRTEAASNLEKMNVLKEAIPGAFEEAEKNYLKSIDNISEDLEDMFQKTLNNGFRQIFLLTAIGSTSGLIMLALYRRRKDEN